MSPPSGLTKNLSEGRVQALQAILNSVSSEDGTSDTPEGGKLTEDQVRRMSAKLGEIFGEDPNIAGDGVKRNEKGEMLNEEGLPIIDINEPEAVAVEASATASFDDPYILPQWALSPEEKARRKAERERILDLLEQEEQMEAEREELSEREQFLEDLERRKQAAKSEMDDLKKAKELQKKMGRALVRNVVEAKEQREQEDAQDLKDADAARASQDTRKPLNSKKSVTFADDNGQDTEANDAAGKWGDVVPARLSKAMASRLDSHTMKMDVVERPARGLRSPPPITAVPQPDSDDESNPDVNPIDDDEDTEEFATHDDSGDSDFDGQDGNGFLDDREPVSDWDEEQFDTVRHQREVALAYHAKRKTMGAQAASAMRAHTHEDEGENEWDHPIVPAEATLSSAPPKPSISKFKANLASSSSTTLASHSLGPYVVPSSQSHVISRAIKFGKLQDGQLVGGEAGESEDELDGPVPTEEEILRLLSEGGVTNIGPSSSHTAPTLGPSQATRRSSVPAPAADRAKSVRPQKAVLRSFDSPVSDQSTAYSPFSSTLSTPIAEVGRSSPKMGTPTSPSPAPDAIPLPAFRKPAMIARVTERPRQRVNSSEASASSQRARNSLPAISGDIESPSFSSGSTATPPFQSMIVESPSFVAASSSQVSSKAEVKESGSVAGTTSTGTKGGERKKVSRFLAERG